MTDGAGVSDLTAGQRRLWTAQQLNADVPLYNMAVAFEIAGTVDTEHLRRALASVLRRSDALRGVVEVEGGVARWRTRPTYEVDLTEIDLSGAPDPDGALDVWLAERAARPLDPARDPVDSALVRLGDDRTVWFLNQHHLITDAWSTGLVFEAIAEAYARSIAGTLSDAPDLPAYRAYVDYLGASTDAPAARRAREHWAEQGWGATEPVPLYGKTGPRRSTATARVTVELGAQRSNRLRALGARSDLRSLTGHLSLSNLFAALLFTYLHKVSGQESLVIGTPSHNRPTADFKRTPGLFIEVFPFSVTVEPEGTFESLVRDVRAASMTFLRNALPGTSDPAGNRAYNVVLNYIHASYPRFCGMETRSLWIHSGHGDLNHDLRLQVHDLDAAGRFVLHFDLSVERFDADEREAVTRHFLHLLDRVLATPSIPLTELGLVGAEEARAIVDATSRGEGAPVAHTVVEFFAEQARRTPSAVAVQEGAAEWTYQELDSRSAELAERLRALGAGGERVGLLMGRSREAVLGILGTLRSGGAYVPLDPASPDTRLAAMVAETAPVAILTLGRHRERAALMGAPVLALDEPEAGRPPAEPGQGDAPRLSDPAYVLYTSGSSGRPKGVVVTHGGLAAYVSWARDRYAGDAAPAFPLHTPVTFDLTVTSIFVPLSCGGRVVVYPEERERGDLALLQVLDDDCVDAIKLTPSHLTLLGKRDLSRSRVRTLIVGGEDLKSDLAGSVHRAFGGRVTIFNEYGPTEATVGCTLHRYDPEVDVQASVPIGRPVAGARVYVLNEARRPVPPGVPGEIVVGGPGVAAGYLARPEETDQRFVPDLLDQASRMYHTGDLGRWRPDGTLEYLGRADRQVKVRGARVELAEVEAAVAAHPEVAECVVELVARPDRPTAVIHCERCGLPSDYPDARLDHEGVCELCRRFTTYADAAGDYFGDVGELAEILARARARKTGQFDCIMLLSGGKDSSYALYRLVDMGLAVLAVTLDNGFISERAKENIRRITAHLGVDHEFMTTPAMNAVFVDSLQRYANVCNGCFKAMYTLATNLALERGIPAVVTGLSRGQFFETRLTEELLCSPNATREVIDGVVLDARRAYHRVDDAVSRLMDTSAFETDQVFERVEFVDFYRYCDVELEEVLRFLDEQAPWIRPDDTGRSTNCLINDVGIFVHRRERGYHNYALPYSWDVRLGHKDRDAAIAELDDRIDEARVREILDEIGYGEVVPAEADPDRLVAYYTADRAVPVDELRRAAHGSLPSYMVPREFVRLERIPLTANGKVDREALPSPQAARPDVAVPFEAPTGDVEAQLAAVWCRVLRLDRVGRNDNFFDLGGDSISAIQIAARASAAGLKLDPNLVFRRQTVAELATAVSPASPGDAEPSPDGPVPLTPVQRWFFDRDPHGLAQWNQHWLLECEAGTDPDQLAAALARLPNHHDALRLRYRRVDGEWRQRYEVGSEPVPLSRVSVAGLAAVDRQERIREASEALHASFDLEQGPLIGAVLFDAGPGAASQVLVAVHHLVVDGVSWTFLLEDLAAILRGKRDALPIRLPPKTASYGQWSRSLQATAGAADLTERWSDWLAALEGARPLVVDRPGEGPPLSADSRRVRLVLTPQQTQAVLEAARRLASGRVDDLLLAGLACALRARADGAPILVDVEAHGRDAPAGDVDVSRTVGWFTAIYPESLPTDLEPGEVLGHLARRRAEAPGPPQELALALAREAGHAEWRPGSPGPRANVLVNYLGRLDLSSEPGACLRPVGALGLARGPATRRSHVLEVGAYVAGDKLTVLWDYCERSLAPETIRGASARLAEVLIEFSEAEAQPRTAAFPRVDLDESELSKVAELLEKADRRHG